jgi:tRNA dimethylallyltransferase
MLCLLKNNQISHMNNTIFCLAGPTAVGKSSLAMALADELPIEIVSVDSAQVYRGMDIGTAKPSIAEQQAVPHHLLDCCDPSKAFSAGDFVIVAQQAIAAIQARQRIPVLVGGTMLYYRALIEGFSALPAAQPEIRAELAAQAEQVGWAQLHARLESIDPAAFARIHPHDKQRISRALEVYMATGKALSEHAPVAASDYNAIMFAVLPQDRAVLHQRIAQRLELMFEQDFLAEVRALYERGDLHADLPSMRSVGYRQAWSYLAGEIDYATMRDKALFATRQLAKRQLTWLRHQADAITLAMEDSTAYQQVVKQIRSNLGT